MAGCGGRTHTSGCRSACCDSQQSGGKKVAATMWWQQGGGSKLVEPKWCSVAGTAVSQTAAWKWHCDTSPQKVIQ
eukprot:1161627-Pelagomonas_calceolata.AAC.1